MLAPLADKRTQAGLAASEGLLLLRELLSRLDDRPTKTAQQRQATAVELDDGLVDH